MLTPKIALLALLAASPLIHAHSDNQTPNPTRRHTCIVPSKYAASNGTADDTPAVQRAFAQCATDSTILFPKGIDYNILQPFSATNLSNVEIRMYGNLHLPRDMETIKTIVDAHGGSVTWFTISGPRVDWTGPEDVRYGWINSYGQQWWDANPPGGTGIAGRPHLLSYSTSQATLTYFRSRKPIAWNVKLKGDDIAVRHAIVDAYSSGGFPFNTDGFGVSGNNIRISDSVIYNGDDAIAVGDGSHNIVFERNTIGYQTHGMSIGSLGKDPTDFANITNLRFEDVTVIDALYAARFKSWSGGQGLVRNVTWKNIRVFNVTFPIFVTQSYWDQGADRGDDVDLTNAVVMEDFTWDGFSGSINTYQPGDGSCASDPCWYDVGLPNLQHTEGIIIECATTSSCHNFAAKNIQLYPQNLDAPTVICLDATAALNPKLGFDCRNGTYVPLSN